MISMAYSNRFGSLGRLQQNWPGKYSMDRVSFLERELRQFDNETLDEGVTYVLRHSEFPPTVAALASACSRIASRRKVDSASEKNSAMPGDIVHGERTLTVEEAKAELISLKSEYPDAFSLSCVSDSREGLGLTKPRLELVLTSAYIKMLRVCISKYGQKPDQDVAKYIEMDELMQADLF